MEILDMPNDGEPVRDNPIPPFELIIRLVNRFIKRQSSINRMRIIVTIIAVIIATYLLYKSLFELMPDKNLTGVASSLIGLSAVLYGTIGFGLFNPYLSNLANIKYCKDTKEELEDFVKNNSVSDYKSFLTSFYELIKTLLK